MGTPGVRVPFALSNCSGIDEVERDAERIDAFVALREVQECWL